MLEHPCQRVVGVVGPWLYHYGGTPSGRAASTAAAPAATAEAA
ncbi:hypothetical protein I553_3481 [Mycobacterium xenopi 4042]|uniref:Uncharacterized protein n=1 Tax=Mycobacterium xenopi 4042 TaxID=1299334 RepID=X7ZZ36_MYCXE|nr:hypothetical protein I553_3481 [Mycobacterium xenopi 4042]